MPHPKLTGASPLTFTLLLLPSSVRAWVRTVGSPTDPRMAAISRTCNGTDPTSYLSGHCPGLLRCVMSTATADVTAGMSAGSNIASLIPTTLALIGTPPLELVQLAIVAPHRAIATVCFGIGLPSSLFRQLKPVTHGLAQRIVEEPLERKWVFQAPGGQEVGWKTVLLRVLVDLVIMGLGAVMLWYNWKINSETMVTWRCEYGWLLFAWPCACVCWLLVATVLLWAVHEKFTISYEREGRRPQLLSLWQLMALPYGMGKAACDHEKEQLGKVSTEHNRGVTHAHAGAKTTSHVGNIDLESTVPSGTKATHRSTDSAGVFPIVTITIKVPHQNRWRWYETILECSAVGIYLYATFVLTSTVFMSGEMGLTFASVMTLSLCAIRILEISF
ncbi:hypothetical protein Tdes44962_MAKER06919 [Teratosphaeria destructans]|uniref:Uncharacterized protein n=1 Tax=Teratosphaeria destructans TaxID=418781 RepID=A0A9W7W706_9PEZI|nr:hypothetical protein Tdes44962_MAKER06919 [Teratosphaeria destructans]